ncbi:piggyBac transposable element-derived protein 3-like [Macrobrachium rosenbergii]|uniref:piggyBac transposable element-derived protein 3-like n=1 Tax=Macrobrachium rosenbergii TaxID=79674 RepID=UPI0034D61383
MGYKFFYRADLGGIIHDILMYQGRTAFIAHTVKLPEEEALLNMSAKVDTTLLRTVKHPNKTLPLCWHCQGDQNRKPSLIPTAQFNSKKTKRLTMDYRSCNGVLALKWKDNKEVSMLSTDAGVETLTSVRRYDRDAKEKVYVPYPGVIKQYNGKMGGIDKSDMLTHLYMTPLRSRRWPLKIFEYCTDVSIANAWLKVK